LSQRDTIVNIERALYTPWRIACVYLFGTLAAYWLSRESTEEISNLGTLTAFVAVSYSCFLWGYSRGAAHRMAAQPADQPRDIGWYRTIFWGSCLWTVALNVGRLAGRSYYEGDILEALLNPGHAYRHKLESIQMYAWLEEVNVVGQIYTLSYGVTLLFPAILTVYWHLFRWPAKVLAILALASGMLYDLADGTNAAVGFTFSHCAVCMGAYYLWHKDGRHKLTALRVKSLLFAMGASFIGYFIVTQVTRTETTSIYISDDLSSDKRSLLPEIRYGLDLLVFYPTHGYTGLAQCLELPFEWCYGLGHSRALMEYAEQYFEFDKAREKHYLWRNQLETGRHPGIVWSTALPWFASDVSFWGVPPLLAIIGYLFGKSWKETILFRSPVSLTLSAWLSLLVLFLPANNIIFQARWSMFGTWELLAFYAWSRLVRRN